MPVYEYECNSCHYHFDKRQGFNDAPLAECPKCLGVSRRVFYPTPIIFKGSGFYVTDNRGNSDGDGHKEFGEKLSGESDAGREKSTTSEGVKETSE